MYKIVPSNLKILFLGIFLVIGSLTCFSQNTAQKNPFWEKVRFGGGIGFNFTNGGFNGSIAPSAIYQFNEVFAAGLSANVNFYKFNNQKFWAYGPSANCRNSLQCAA